MSLPNVPTLIKRLVKGSPLTHAEGDANWTAIEATLQMLLDLYGVSLNPDGSLTANSVDTTQIKNRAVTPAKLGSVAVHPPVNDSGSANNVVVNLSPALTSYEDGMAFLVYVAADNTGVTKFRAGALPQVSLYKNANTELESGDLKAGALVLIGYSAGKARVLLGGSSSSSSSTSSGFSGFSVFAPSNMPIPPAASTYAMGTLTSSGVTPTNGDTVTIGATTYTLKTSNVGMAANDVYINGSAANALINLKKAVNLTGVAGTDYGTGTVANASATAGTITATTLEFTAITVGDPGNLVATTDTAATLNWGAATLTGGITDTFISLGHGLGSIPELEIGIVCTSTDLGLSAGDFIPVSDLTDGAGLQSFLVKASTTNLYIGRQTSDIVPPGLSAIDESKWEFRIKAVVKTAVSASVFPALQYNVKQGQGAMSYGETMWFVGYGAYQNKYYLQAVNLTNSNVILLDAASGGSAHADCNFAHFARADGAVDGIYIGTTGYFRFATAQPSGTWQPVQQFNHAGRQIDKPVHIVESGGNITEIYSITCVHPYCQISSVPAYKATTSSVVHYGTNLDLTSASILSADGTSGNVEFRKWHQAGSAAYLTLFQYNPVKKRIYIQTNETNMLHIFKVNSSVSWLAWWDLAAAARAADLQYVKTIAIAGSGEYGGTPTKESVHIDFDVVTGEERAITFSRYGASTYSSSVTRVPWKE